MYTRFTLIELASYGWARRADYTAAMEAENGAGLGKRKACHTSLSGESKEMPAGASGCAPGRDWSGWRRGSKPERRWWIWSLPMKTVCRTRMSGRSISRRMAAAGSRRSAGWWCGTRTLRPHPHSAFTPRQTASQTRRSMRSRRTWMAISGPGRAVAVSCVWSGPNLRPTMSPTGLRSAEATRSSRHARAPSVWPPSPIPGARSAASAAGCST